MDNRYSVAANIDGQVARKWFEQSEALRTTTSCAMQLSDNSVRSFDSGIIDIEGVGAAAVSEVVAADQLSFDVASDCGVCSYSLGDVAKDGRRNVQVVEVAIEDHHGRWIIVLNMVEEVVQGNGISVEASNHIES